jgi:signal transduction histidine kinase
MNTLFLGLKLLKEEVQSAIELLFERKNDEFVVAKNEKTSQAFDNQVKSWVELIDELQESAKNAVTVLNELISYDKIETNTYHIEKEIIYVWKLTSDVIKPFNIQAREKGVNMVIKLDIENDRFSEHQRNKMADLFFFGDPIKLSQVIRNVVSNSLKFSKRDDDVEISVSYHSESFLNEGTFLPTAFYIIILLYFR